jgi:phage host-nuclease inhibitor protein Gam
VTSCGGRHLGHALTREYSVLDRVAGMVMDWRDMRLVMEGHTHGAILTTGLVVWASKPPCAMDDGFC